MTSLLTSVLEMLCLSGNVLSGIIAFNVWRIQEKSFINRMFFLYFLIDCVIGATDPYFLFKIFRERSVLLWSVTSILHILFLRYDGELQQEQNCKLFLATWMLWALQRGIYNTAMMGIRYKYNEAKSFIVSLFRFFYVRHASNLLKAGFKLLQILIFVFLGIYIIKRNIMWTFGHLLRGTEFQRMPKGIFCMAKNLTEVIRSLEKDQRKEYYHPTFHKGKITIIINTFIFNSVVTYFFLAALKSR